MILHAYTLILWGRLFVIYILPGTLNGCYWSLFTDIILETVSKLMSMPINHMLGFAVEAKNLENKTIQWLKKKGQNDKKWSTKHYRNLQIEQHGHEYIKPEVNSGALEG